MSCSVNSAGLDGLLNMSLCKTLENHSNGKGHSKKMRKHVLSRSDLSEGRHLGSGFDMASFLWINAVFSD